MSEAPPELEIRAPRHRDEVAFANELMAKAHRGNYYESLRKIQSLAAYPNHRPEHTRLAYWNGELAGTLRITADTIRIGEARLQMGGLGWVSTAEEHRHKGIARELVADTMNHLRARGFHVAMLFGIPNFYHRFGFHTVLGEHEVRVATLDSLAAPHAPCRVRPIKPGDVPTIQRLHNASDNATACSIIRIAPHLTLKWDRWKQARVLTDDRGKVTAYFVPRRTPAGLQIDELGLAERAHCGDLLHACALIAQEELAQDICFHVPPGHPFVQHLLHIRSRHEAQHTRDEGGMMAIVNLGETLESMLPEWDAQLQASAARSLRVEATLMIDRVPCRLRANKGALDIAIAPGANKCSLTQAEFTQLLTGSRYLDDILSQRRRILSPEARLLLTALFPKRTPYVWLLDRF